MATHAFSFSTKADALLNFIHHMQIHAAHHDEPPYPPEHLSLCEVTPQVEVIEWAPDGVGEGVCVGFIVELKGTYLNSVLLGEVFGQPKEVTKNLLHIRL